MAYKHLFIDSDILIDYFLKRVPFAEYTELLLIECNEQKIKLSTSVLIIANINYILSKKLGKAQVKENIRTLTSILTILPFESEIIDMALDINFTDFEDAIQYSIAKKHNCDAIITRNIKDYKHSTIPVLTAEQFLNTL